MNNSYTFNFGKHTGKTFNEVLELDTDYIIWLDTIDLDKDLQVLVTSIKNDIKDKNDKDLIDSILNMELDNSLNQVQKLAEQLNSFKSVMKKNFPNAYKTFQVEIIEEDEGEDFDIYIQTSFNRSTTNQFKTDIEYVSLFDKMIESLNVKNISEGEGGSGSIWFTITL